LFFFLFISNIKIDITAKKHSIYIVLGPFHKASQSASVDLHSAPTFFCFLSLLLFLCYRVYRISRSTKTNHEHEGKNTGRQFA
jgi:hypothetical protein